MKTYAHLWSYLAQYFLEWEMYQTKVAEKIKTHILCSITFIFRKSRRLWDNVKKIDDMMYLSTATGLTHGGNSTVHIYTQCIEQHSENRIYRTEHTQQ
jgi:hypothetical protein